MPLPPDIQNDDVIVTTTMTSLITSGGADARAYVASPVAGKLKGFLVQTGTTVSPQCLFAVQTRQGTIGSVFTLPNNLAGPLWFDVSQMDRSNFVEAGEAFLILSLGNSGAGGLTTITAVIHPS